MTNKNPTISCPLHFIPSPKKRQKFQQNRQNEIERLWKPLKQNKKIIMYARRRLRQ